MRCMEIFRIKQNPLSHTAFQNLYHNLLNFRRRSILRLRFMAIPWKENHTVTAIAWHPDTRTGTVKQSRIILRIIRVGHNQGRNRSICQNLCAADDTMYIGIFFLAS